MLVPADCILVESSNVICDESAHTGESEAYKEHLMVSNQNKSPVPILLKDGLVSQGDGRALVLAVGPNTRSG